MDISKNPQYMFKKPLLDYFFKWSWWTAPIVFLPISSVAFIYSYAKLSIPLVAIVPLALAGLFLWTFFEYCVHRFLFHFIGETPAMQHMHYVLHGMHHAYPTDPARVIFSPISSTLAGLLIAGILMAIFPMGLALCIFGGFIMGYSWYEFFHYAAHHIKWRFSWFSRLKRHHLLHHHSGNYRSKNFGVTSAFWDRIFGTLLP